MSFDQRPREPMLVRQAIDSALARSIDLAFAIALNSGRGVIEASAREDFRKAVNAALDLHAHAIAVFVNGKAS